MEKFDNPAQHIDPLKVHNENMKLLKVLPATGNRSAPNSPRMRKAAEGKTVTENQKSLTPNVQRKDFAKVTEDHRSSSLTYLSVDSSDRSPKQSPVGSPSLSVSDKLIRTHYLSNTTGKPGSFLLKKSDEILKQKESPYGSPRMHNSPHVIRKSVEHSPSSANRFRDKSPSALEFPAVRTNNQIDLDDEDDEDDEAERAVLDEMRDSIGATLSKPKPVKVDETSNKAKTADDKDVHVGVKGDEATAKPKKKSRRHRHKIYGDTGLSPGHLHPPKEPRGSKDLTVEMQMWERKQKLRFESLDIVEEGSSTGPSEDGVSIEDIKSHLTHQAFAMPPVSKSIPHVPQVRDYSVPLEIQGDIDENTWEDMKRVRYLRFHGDEEEDGELAVSSGSSSDEDERSEKSDEN